MTKRIVFPLFFVALLFTFGCEEDTTGVNTVESDLEQAISVASLPEQITNFLAINYPTTETVSATVFKNDGETFLYRTTENDGTEVLFDRSGQDAEQIEVDALPQSILDYINDNYSGETIEKAAIRTNLDESITYYLIVSNVGVVKFDAEGGFLGSFTKGDRKKWHHKKHPKGEHEAIDVVDLPATATEFIASDFPDETITDAEKVTLEDGTIIFLAKVSNIRGVFAFSEDGSFIRKIGRRGNGDHCTFGNATEVAVADLPAAIASAIALDYPEASIERAKMLERNDGEVIYFVKISTKRKPLAFDGDGNGV